MPVPYANPISSRCRLTSSPRAVTQIGVYLLQYNRIVTSKYGRHENRRKSTATTCCIERTRPVPWTTWTRAPRKLNAPVRKQTHKKATDRRDCQYQAPDSGQPVCKFNCNALHDRSGHRDLSVSITDLTLFGNTPSGWQTVFNRLSSETLVVSRIALVGCPSNSN